MSMLNATEREYAIVAVDTGHHGRQRGVTLVVSLLFLLLMTILGVTALNTSTLQEKMAGNLRDQDLAFQGAESALRAGELAIGPVYSEDTYAGDVNCTSTICEFGSAQPLNDIWWNANSIEYGGAGPDLGLADDPRYSIEFLQEVSVSAVSQPGYGSSSSSKDRYYRITARAVGATQNSQSILESHFRISPN